MIETSTRRKIKVERVTNVDELGQITNDELMELSDKYDPEHYNPLDNIEKKEIVTDNREVVVTMRFTKEENDLLKLQAERKRISKSAFIRSVLLDAINSQSSNVENRTLIELKHEVALLNKHLKKIKIIEPSKRTSKKS